MSKKDNEMNKTVKSVAKQLLDGLVTAYYHFKKYTDNYNKGLWIRAQTSQHEQALSRVKLTLHAFLKIPWHQFLDPLYVKSKWIDKNIDFALVMIKIIKPHLMVKKDNIHEIPGILFALVNDKAFLDRYTEILDKTCKAREKFIELKKNIDEEYNAFIEDIRSKHVDPYGFELNSTAESELKNRSINEFVSKKFESVGARHTTRVGPGGGKRTRKKRIYTLHL